LVSKPAFDKYIDLLAIDTSGSVIIIKLKRNKTPRDVVAQVIDYASGVVDIDVSKLVDIW
jgi:RecB family endonuclease NucS